MALHDGFEAMVASVVAGLAERGHPGVTATTEFALQAIHEGAQDASALGRALGVSKQAAAKTIASLEQMRYVERRDDPSDARRKVLVVTGRGDEMVAIGAALFDDLRDTWVEKVGRATAERVEEALGLLTDR